MTQIINRRNVLLIAAISTFLVLAVFATMPHSSATTTEAFQTRCGWFSNPTPANASLFDREDEWIIGVQGGHQADGDWPTFGKRQWIETNGHYGYGCACIQVSVNRKEHEVIKIVSAKAKALSVCRRDPSLKRWSEFK
jgi:hypothetical protein